MQCAPPTPMRQAGPRPFRVRLPAAACLVVAALLAMLSGTAGASSAVVTLKPGQFRWFPQASPAGPVVAVVSLDEQRVYVYRNGVAIGVSSISSGRRGYETPEGTFTILQKAKFHKSDLYDDAPMPYMQRLTWDGVAMHAGPLPGYPASHGCIRLPTAFARKLFEVTRRGETIVIASSKSSAPPIARPALLAPIAPSGSPIAAGARAAAWWREWTSYTSDPLSILVALHDRRVYVLRGGELIGESPLEISGEFPSNGSLILVADAQFDGVPSRLDPLWPRRRWAAYAFDYVSLAASLDWLAEHVRVPADFARRLYAEIDSGTTVLVTHLPGIRAAESPVSSPVDPGSGIR